MDKNIDQCGDWFRYLKAYLAATDRRIESKRRGFALRYEPIIRRPLARRIR